MIDLVYPICNKPSYWKDNEIIFSLRSVEKHVKNVGKIWMVGRVPDGITGVEHIHAKDEHDISDQNIMAKVVKACENPEVSDPFLFMNDDHYLLQDFDAEDFPYFFESTLQVYITRRGMDSYGHRAANTMKLLQSKGFPTRHYDIHYPILYHKQAFIDNVAKAVDPNKKHFYVLKSMYANSMNAQGIEVKDCKQSTAPPSKSQCFSSTPRVSGAVYQFLKYRLPEKSKYEK